MMWILHVMYYLCHLFKWLKKSSPPTFRRIDATSQNRVVTLLFHAPVVTFLRYTKNKQEFKFHALLISWAPTSSAKYIYRCNKGGFLTLAWSIYISQLCMFGRQRLHQILLCFNGKMYYSIFPFQWHHLSKRTKRINIIPRECKKIL